MAAAAVVMWHVLFCLCEGSKECGNVCSKQAEKELDDEGA